ncbi:hypothetical protein LTR17_002164 [Elasticomyces elasticus]|nr:hypothetical protein LTR17_002164 [Elasticomyces elasticus]
MITSRYNYALALFVALGSFTYGFSNSVIGSVLGLPSFYAYFDLASDGSGASGIIGATSGLFAGGGALGALCTHWLADRFGRVRAIQIAAAICAVSGAIQAGSVHVAMFLIGRFISGLGVGLLVSLVPVYQSEISPAETRGRVVGTHGFLIVTGYAISAWVGYACFFSTNQSFQWRFELAVQSIAPLLLLAGSPWLPESPRYLIEKDRDDQAIATLTKFAPVTADGVNEELLFERYHDIRAQISSEQRAAEQSSKWHLFTKPSLRKRLLCGTFTQFILQSTGVLVINNYQVLLYNGLGLYNSVPLLLYAVYLTWAAGMNYLSSLIIDKVGRVRLMVIGLIGCVASIICETAMIAEYSGTSNRIGNGFGVFFLFLFVTFYGSCLDATSYVYCAEIFPTHHRATGMGYSIFTQFCTTLVYTQVAPLAFQTIGWKYYLVFILVPAAGALVLVLYFPDTNGLSLEEMAAAFGDTVAHEDSGLPPGAGRTEKDEPSVVQCERV